MRKELLQAAEINTLGSTKKVLKGISENLFPVNEDMSYESQKEEEVEETEE